jgi:hypothetical protein
MAIQWNTLVGQDTDRLKAEVNHVILKIVEVGA